jgi:hypothetical protein
MAGVLDTIGSVLGTSNRDQINAAKDTLYGIQQKADQTTEANKALMGQYLQQMQDTYGENSEKYNEALQNVADAIGNREDFSYTKDVNSFLDPAREQRVSSAMNALNNASAAGGNRFGSSYLNKLAAQQQAMASDEYEKAFSRMQTDRSNALQEWQTGQQNINNLTNLASLYGNDRTALSDALGNYYSNLANANNAALQTYSNVGSGLANLEAQKNNGVWDAVGGVAKIAGSIFGGGA